MSNKLLRNFIGVHTLAIAFFLTLSSNLSAATFTAAASGNWSSSATWVGGTAPGTVSNNDVIIIGAGIDVNLDQNVELTGALSSLQVLGTLTTSNSSDLTITQGTLLGTGEIVVDELELGALAIVTFTGDVTANSFQSAATAITLALDLTVNQTLELTGGVLTIGTGGSVGLQNNSTIVINGGSLSLTGTGVLSLNNNYNVVYNGSSANGGLELTGNGLNNVTINLSNSGQSLNLTGNLTVDGMLSVQGGQLNTNGHNLTLNGGFNVTGGGTITGSNTTNITLNGSTGGSLSFTAGSQSVNNLTINLPSSATVNLTSDLHIHGTLGNSSGTLNISDVELTIGGNISGNGSIHANGNSSLTLDGNASIGGALNITSSGSGNGGVIGDLTIDLGGSNSVSLGGDLTISGTLALTSGGLSLNGNDLTITGNISASGSGNINGGTGSSINIMTSGNVSGNLTLGASGQGQVLENLTIDIDNNGTIRLGSNITVNGTLELAGGNLNTNGNTITLGAGADVMIDASANVMGTGNFNGSAGFDLTVTGSGDVELGIFGTGSGLGDLTIDLDDATSYVSIGNDITVNGTLDLQGGSLDLNGYNLTINGNISGGVSGHITSDGNSSITINSATTTTGGLSFGGNGGGTGNGNAVGTLTINIQDGGSVSILSDLTVEDELAFTSGLVVLADGNLTIAAGGQITGAGNNSYVVTTAQGGLWLDVAGNGSATFDIGTANNYTPAEITLNGSTSGMFGVHVNTGVWTNGTSGGNAANFQSLVNATWYVESSMTANLDIDLQVEWSSSMEVNGFNNDSAYISHYTNGAWDTYAAASATAEASGRFSLTREGITSLSPFAVVDKSASVGIREVAATEDLTIFPNPAINTVTIPANFQTSTVKIVDLNGATVMELNSANNQNVTVDVSSLSNGVYVVKVVGENSVSTGRFVKN